LQLAKSRDRTGWIAQGLRGYNDRRIRRIKADGNVFLIPDFSKQRSIGIDTSGLGNNDSVIVICSIPDYEGVYIFLERHLKLPKDHYKKEFHWSKLNATYREELLKKFEFSQFAVMVCS